MVFSLFFYGFLIILLKSTWHGLLYIPLSILNCTRNLFIYYTDSCPFPFWFTAPLDLLLFSSTCNTPLHCLVHLLCVSIDWGWILSPFADVLATFWFPPSSNASALCTTSRNHSWYISFCFDLKVHTGTKGFDFSRFVRETVAESNAPGGGVAKVE